MPCVLGHALSMHALQGGHAPHDTLAAQNITVLRRGGLLPPASVDSADMRATRDRLRRRRPCRRQRAERLPPVQHTHRQDTRPERGRKRADNTHRDGGAERCAAPAGPNRLDGALALMGHDDARRRDVEPHRSSAA
jgi:hypothetical protein